MVLKFFFVVGDEVSFICIHIDFEFFFVNYKEFATSDKFIPGFYFFSFNISFRQAYTADYCIGCKTDEYCDSKSF